MCFLFGNTVFSADLRLTEAFFFLLMYESRTTGVESNNIINIK